MDNKIDDDRISWHPAFFEAIQMEFDEYSQHLQFISEFPLTTESLRIDVVIIKKEKDISIKKNIASIFRKENIIEYKNPDDHISENDFYLVYAYACLYKVLNKLDISDLSLTLIGSRYPWKLITHLQGTRAYTVEEKWPGIYIVNGDILPIQIIINRKLSVGENIWLKDLDNILDVPGLQRITAEIHSQGKAARIRAYLDVIMRANKETLEEALSMSDTALTLEQILENAGLVAKWEAKGKAEGEAIGKEHATLTIAQNMVNLGLPIEVITSATQLEAEKVKALYSNEQ